MQSLAGGDDLYKDSIWTSQQGGSRMAGPCMITSKIETEHLSKLEYSSNAVLWKLFLAFCFVLLGLNVLQLITSF